MQLRNCFAVSVNLSYSTAMLIYSTVEGEPRICRLPVWERASGGKIADSRVRRHLEYRGASFLSSPSRVRAACGDARGGAVRPSW
jgi:hypothetical protein